MRLYTTNRFDRELTTLLKSRRLTRSQINKTLNLLTNNPRHPSLRLHKLSGTDNVSISVDKDIRIIFNKESYILYLLRIGSHDEVY